LLIVAGVFQVIAGLTGIVKDETTIFAATADNTYFLNLDTTSWGWTHLIIGIVLFLAGLGVLAGQVWARTVGVGLAAISAIVNFAFIPIYPVWAIVVIAIDVAIIWALTAHGRDIAS
jgi:hypothetical protein